MEDCLVDLAQIGPRLEAKLVGQRASCILVRVERIGLASRPIQRQHQLRAEALGVWMLANEGLDLRNDLEVMPERELGVDPVFERAASQLFESRDLRLRRVQVGKVGKGATPPEPECFCE